MCPDAKSERVQALLVAASVLRRARLHNFSGATGAGEANTGSAGGDGARSRLERVAEGVASNQRKLFVEVEALAADVLRKLSPHQSAAWRCLFRGEAGWGERKAGGGGEEGDGGS